MSSIETEEKKDASYVVTEGVTEPAVLDANNESIVHQYSVKRVMTTRQIQFYAIGGTIGTAVFVSVSTMLSRSCGGSNEADVSHRYIPRSVPICVSALLNHFSKLPNLISFFPHAVRSGPLFLLLGYIIWCSVIYCVNEGQGIMVSRIARESAFTRFATGYVDEAFGFATGVNYFIQTCSLLCFEVTALHSVIGFWYPVSVSL